MKTVETKIEPSARTFLKSTAHVRVREKKGNYVRSIAVGLQFAAFLPYEIGVVVIWPFIRNVFGDIFIALDSLIFVIWSAISFLISGFFGCLEAADEPVVDELGEE